MRLIDADAFKRYVQEGYETTKEMFHGKYRELVDAVTKGLLNDIDEQPTIKPQPEIIRCKDCKHRDPEDKKCDCGHDILWQLPRDDNWFCADAERGEAQHGSD